MKLASHPITRAEDRGIAMAIQSPQELLIHKLQAIQDAENQASQAIERLMSEVEDEELREMLERRVQQGEEVLKIVELGLEGLDGKGKAERNEAARGLITETEKLLKQVEAPEMKEAVIIAGMQSLEHYCIAAWGTVKAIALELGQEELVDGMQKALDEGYAWDREMTELAEEGINPIAMEEGDEDEAGEGRASGGKEGKQAGQKAAPAKQAKKGGTKQARGGKDAEDEQDDEKRQARSKEDDDEGQQRGGKGRSRSEGKQDGSSKQGMARGGESGSEGKSQTRGKSQGGGKAASSSAGQSRTGGGSSKGGSGGNEASDLKSREYRDDDGNIHHHTREYMERHRNGER
jgi:ferritin-like metal-binding protein YciE